jgi:hypothetical protein
VTSAVIVLVSNYVIVLITNSTNVNRGMRRREARDDGRQGKRLVGRRSDIAEEIEIIGHSPDTPAGASGRKLNDINAPRAIRLSGGPKASPLLVLF